MLRISEEYFLQGVMFTNVSQNTSLFFDVIEQCLFFFLFNLKLMLSV